MKVLDAGGVREVLEVLEGWGMGPRCLGALRMLDKGVLSEELGSWLAAVAEAQGEAAIDVIGAMPEAVAQGLAEEAGTDDWTK